MDQYQEEYEKNPENEVFISYFIFNISVIRI